MEEVQQASSNTTCIKDSKKNNLKKMKVVCELYENDGVVYELLNPKLTKFNKIIKVNISSCACYCSDHNYYWLITKQGKWIQLPFIEVEDFKLTQTTKNYSFLKNEIQLVEE
ncbi:MULTISPECIES: hypothetical protein [unclassified Polaribacter]|uniref:hypothetical protein n=1 Tax=unclassified Polaribacter TaxID=196858 RepID=UPI0011BDA4EB|nr:MULTISPECIES: hypothetical protein [unclassified Polaribacter]TXD50803.1 hypothetical protein ES043_14655 [Polaribacter sp. IC063]TXD57541.1 hypothetical protein ES044_14820 [Polaribacter sp. IC066]